MNILKRQITLLGMLLVIGLGTGTAVAQDTKIGIVNLEQALFNSEAAQSVNQELQSEFSGDQQRGIALQGELVALQERFQKDEAIMSDSEKRQLNADAQEKQLQLQLISERLQQSANEKNQQFVDGMRQTLSAAITDVVAEGGYDLVLNAASVAYADPVLDITPKVTAKINEKTQAAAR